MPIGHQITWCLIWIQADLHSAKCFIKGWVARLDKILHMGKNGLAIRGYLSMHIQNKIFLTINTFFDQTVHLLHIAKEIQKNGHTHHRAALYQFSPLKQQMFKFQCQMLSHSSDIPKSSLMV